MSSIDYIVDILLIVVIFRQLRPSALSARSVVLPLAIMAYAGAHYLHGFPVGGNDVLLTAVLTVTGLPVYLWFFGLNWFHVGMFFLFVWLTGFSITAGYHRLFAHKSYQAKWPLRLMVLLFGASAFENSVLLWTSEHRRHLCQSAPSDAPRFRRCSRPS